MAKSAIKALTGQINSQIVRGAKNEPIWPQGLTGSISHTDDTAICLLTSLADTVVGVDLETIIEGELASSICRKITNPSEIERFEFSRMPFNQIITTIFSAKETLFKALFPKVKRYFGFKCAKVTRVYEVNNQYYLELMLTVNLSEEFTCGVTFDIRYECHTNQVRTFLVQRMGLTEQRYVTRHRGQV